ncbi:TIGR02186 family protein [Meridianimarinicoccus sp. RP-17]|uniref:TIGR02186 family protein n=1 Tax=Meridianimarinicoccus zhengii TaxID=2056810 RepID=UPI000DADE169|nr:TIGR02186 family protein [Phycocomes zhengii]
MIRAVLAAAILWVGTLPGLASERIVLGLSQDEVAITATFDGSSLLIFGAVSREAPIPSDGRLEVIITVTGPLGPLDVRRKERQFGIWVNADSVWLSEAPSFYAVASTGPLKDILSPVEDLRHGITLGQVINTVGARESVQDVENFTAALRRIRESEGLYQINEGSVALDQQTLFRTSIELPSNLVEGSYQTRIFLLRNRDVVDIFTTGIPVRKVGMERWLYTTANTQPVLYGLMSLVIAIAAGWGASALFRLLQR